MNPINILCAADDKYAPYCGVMLTSLFDNNIDREINVYIMLDKPWSVQNMSKVNQLKEKYNQSIKFCEVNNAFFEKYKRIIIRLYLLSQKDVSHVDQLLFKPIYMLPYILESQS